MPEAKGVPRSKTTTSRVRVGEGTPYDGDAFRVDHEHAKGLFWTSRERTTSLPPDGVSDEDHACPYQDAEGTARIRQTGEMPVPYWTNSKGEFLGNPFPDEINDVIWRRGADPQESLVRAYEHDWLPTIWKAFEEAGLPHGSLVFLQSPQGDWIAEDSPDVPQGVSGASPGWYVCPAWRLPWAFRFPEEHPASIAAELLQIAIMLVEQITKPSKSLLARFIVQDDDDGSAPSDDPWQIGHLWAQAEQRWQALRSLTEPMREDNRATKYTATEAALKAVRSAQAASGLRGWKKDWLPWMQEKIASGRAKKPADLVNLLLAMKLYRVADGASKVRILYEAIEDLQQKGHLKFSD